MRKSLVALALCLAVASAGCFGKFALTRKIYGFNAAVSGDKFVRSIVTWVLVIVPVYAFGGLVDFVILNPIEFWTGANPVVENERCEGSKVAVVELPDGSATYQCGGVSFRLAPSGAGSFTLERDGAVVGTAETSGDGGLRVMGPSGEVIQTLTASEVEARAVEAEAIASVR